MPCSGCSPLKIIKFGCHLTDRSVAVSDLDRQSVAGNSEINPTAGESGLARSRLPGADGAGLRQHDVAKLGRLIWAGQNGQGMGRSTLLHHDRDKPCVGGAGSDQAVPSTPGQSRGSQIINVGLDQHSRLRRSVL